MSTFNSQSSKSSPSTVVNTNDVEFPTDESDCTLPPDVPVPAHQLRRYSPERDSDAERDIANYVESTADDETIQHVERVKTEYVFGAPYEIWDVTTNKDRWWVITNPTNLYSQRYFPSLDYTLSFHLGLTMRLVSKERRSGDGTPTPLYEVFRRQNQVADLFERAVETVEFQTIGMQLRECMISLVIAVRRRTEFSMEGEYPQDANVNAWSGLIFEKYCSGDRNRELRQYLKATTERTWQLVNWLTHHRNANKTATLIAIEAVDTIISHMANLLARERQDFTDQCPRCASRRLRTFYDMEIVPDGAYFENCGECGWSGHPGYEGIAELDPVKFCESQLDRVRVEYEMWDRSGNKTMIAFSLRQIKTLEEQLGLLRTGAES